MTVSVLVTLDGRVHDAAAPFLAVDDLAAVRGDGVFETLLLAGGVVRAQEPHLDRLVRSAAAMDLPAPGRAAWRDCLAVLRREWTARHADAEAVLRLVISRGREGSGVPTAYATAARVPPGLLDQRRDGVSVLTLDRGFSTDLPERAPWLLLGAKTLSYAVNMAALRHASHRGAEEVVFTSTDAHVLEGPTSTVVLAVGATLVTPPPASGILVGTTQQALFTAASVAGWSCEVRDVAVAELSAADGVWLASSVRLLARVRELDGVVQADAGLTTGLLDLLGANPVAGSGGRA